MFFNKDFFPPQSNAYTLQVSLSGRVARMKKMTAYVTKKLSPSVLFIFSSFYFFRCTVKPGGGERFKCNSTLVSVNGELISEMRAWN